jgi:hypothetical protein
VLGDGAAADAEILLGQVGLEEVDDTSAKPRVRVCMGRRGTAATPTSRMSVIWLGM